MLTNRQEIAFFASLGVFLALLLGLVYIISKQELVEPTREIPNTPLAIRNVSIQAKSAYVYDVNTGTVLYAKSESERLPLASLTKVMSALVARESAPEYSTVSITSQAVVTQGDAGLLPGERWSLKDLLDFSLVSSANDGVRAVALSLGALSQANATERETLQDFVQRMNAKANQIGMLNTYYLNDTGLDESNVSSGAYGSAKDQALLLEHILREYPTLLTATREPAISFVSLEGLLHTAVNTNVIVNNIPGLIASKTGYTDLAGGNLLIAFDPEIGRPIIISILGSTEEGRFQDMQRLVDGSLKSVQNSVKSL